jgi:hypothetical protein
MTVVVLGIRAIGKGQLAAVARVKVAGCVEFDCRIIQPADGEAWLGLPQIPVCKGGTGWTAAVRVTDPAVLEELRRDVLAAWRDAERVPPPERGQRAWR